MGVFALIGRRLETGAVSGCLAEGASRVWGAVVRVHSPLRWREGARVIVIGGATLGGSGKTPLALACAEELHAGGARVVLVGHAHRASPRFARFVCEKDDVRLVGDEALLCRHVLSARNVPVAVAPKRQDALDLALSCADLAIVDGPCQARPNRAALALLAIDAAEPWGAGRFPPRGDLRAPAADLFAATDRVVAIAPEGTSEVALENAGSRPIDRAWVVSNGANLGGQFMGWRELGRYRLGLWTVLARPGRVVTALARHGVHPVVVRASPDHGPARFPRKAPDPRIDLWVCTRKCRNHLPANLWGVSIATLEYSLRLEAPLKAALAHLDPGPANLIGLCRG